MVTIKVSGGIGNQLFQYALGVALKDRLGYNVQYDISFYQDMHLKEATSREFLLGKFKIQKLKVAPSFLILSKARNKLIRKLEPFILPYRKRKYVLERSKNFDPDIFQIRPDAYLNGYWQSYLYFNNVNEKILNELKLKRPLSADAQIIYDKIKKSEASISLHVRRGDYVSKYKHKFFEQPGFYYKNAMAYISGKTNGLATNIFIFSDDLTWCKENFNGEDNITFIGDYLSETAEEMMLMSTCTHNIISNSTFSWWGAWLNNNPQKMVVAPRNWYIDPIMNDQFISSNYPKSWIII